MSEPKVSVILPAYNSEKYLAEAIESILVQSLKDFELIIINDGSKDKTEDIILSYKDSRIIYINNETNFGLIYTLNKGFNLARGKYIARMDADDISSPERLFIQYEFLESNPDYVICSSSRREFSDNRRLNHISHLPNDDTSIRISAIFNTPFTHPGVMLRKSIIDVNDLRYDAEFKYAEDYELWIRVLQYGKGYNFKNILLHYRDTPNSQTSVGSGKVNERKDTISKIQQKALKNLGITLNKKEFDLLYILSLSTHIRNIDFNIYSVSYINAFFKKLYLCLDHIYPEERNKLRRVLGKRYLKIILFNFKRLKLSQIVKFNNFRLIIEGIKIGLNERQQA